MALNRLDGPLHPSSAAQMVALSTEARKENGLESLGQHFQRDAVFRFPAFEAALLGVVEDSDGGK